MPIVAMGQEYFAEQTRRQELAVGQDDAIELLPEHQKRLYRRAELSVKISNWPLPPDNRA